MNLSMKNNHQNLLNLLMAALIIFMVFGCSADRKNNEGDKTESNKKNNSENTSKKSQKPDKSKNVDESSDDEKGDKSSDDKKADESSDDKNSDNLEDNIVGIWKITDRNKDLVLDYGADKKAKMFENGKLTGGTSTYKIIDEDTIEQTDDESGDVERASVIIEGDKMTITFDKQKMTFTRK